MNIAPLLFVSVLINIFLFILVKILSEDWVKSKKRKSVSPRDGGHGGGG